MIDIQTILTNAVQAERNEAMKTSTQLTLGELILKLEAVKDKTLPVVFDNGKYKPTGMGSWRGSYCEFALSYEEDGTYDGYQGTEVEHTFDDGTTYYKSVPTDLPKNPTVNDLIGKLKECLGKTFTGYKGGDFVMGKTTPVWISNYGTSSGWKSEKNKYSQGVVDVEEKKKSVSIITVALDY